MHDLLAKIPMPLLVVPLLVSMAYGLNLMWMRVLWRGYIKLRGDGTHEDRKGPSFQAARKKKDALRN